MVIACQYHELLRHFGGVPLLKTAVSTENDGAIDYSRKTYEETANYIIELCDQAFTELPWTVPASEDGRFTGASALALKTRVLLYLASPLVNSNAPYMTPQAPTAYNQPKMTSNPEHMTWLGAYKADRWQAVVDACEDFFEENQKNGNPYQIPDKTLKNGSKGNSVRWLQYELNLRGFGLIVDGVFGQKTEDAVRMYQNQRKLISDGIVGARTRAELENGK